MQTAWRALLIAVLALAGWDAYRAIAHDRAYVLGRRAYDKGDYRAALESLRAARSRRPADAEDWEWIGDAAQSAYRSPPRGGWDDKNADDLLSSAWGGYAGAVLRSPFRSWSWLGLAEIALERATRADARAGVDLAVLDRRSRGVLDPWRGIALVAAETALELKPSGFQELDVLTRVYTSTGQLDLARDAVIRSARIMPAPTFHTWGEGEALVKPLYDAIMAAMREGLERTPKFERSALHHEIGRFAMDQRDFEGALTEMTAALSTADDPYHRQAAYRGRAQVLGALGRLDEAIQMWDALVASGAATPRDRGERGAVFYRLGRKQESCRDLRDAVHAASEDRTLRVFAAVACEESGELDAAERLLIEGFDLPTDDLILAKGLVDFYVRTDKRSTAEGLVRSWERDFPNREEFRRWAGDLESARP